MRIETARLVLRDVRADDLDAMHAFRSDPRYLEFYDASEGTREGSQRLVDLFLGYQRETPRHRFQLAITLPPSDVLVGDVGIRRLADSETEAELGYELHPDLWGHGYATEAASAMLDFAFGELRLARVSSWCVAENERSARVLLRLGFTEEERRAGAEFMQGRWWDARCFGLSRDAWQARTPR